MKLDDVFFNEYGDLRIGILTLSAIVTVATCVLVLTIGLNHLDAEAHAAQQAQLQSDICSISNNERLVKEGLDWNLKRASNIAYKKIPIISWTITDEMSDGLPPIDLACSAEE